jgi:ribonuclease BN (tRNA processing enzyme)
MVGGMRLTVLGGCGAWPAAGQACSGYLVEHGGFQLLVDPGYATLPRLLEITDAARIDAVLVSHGHPDHCADLNPLLRARVLAADRPPPLPVYTLPGALDAVLALDEPEMMRPGLELREFTAGAQFTAGPFSVASCALPHFVPNAGLRLTAAGHALAYTGDAGPSDDLVTLARGADLLLAEATYPEEVPARHAGQLSSAVQAGQAAARAAVGQLMLTHLWPGTDPAAAVTAARRVFAGQISVARAGIIAGPALLHADGRQPGRRP